MQTTAIRPQGSSLSIARFALKPSTAEAAKPTSESATKDQIPDQLSLSERARRSDGVNKRLQGLSQMSSQLLGRSVRPSPNHATSVQRYEPEKALPGKAHTSAQLDRERQRYGHITNGIKTGKVQQFKNSNKKAVALVIEGGKSTSGYQSYGIRTGSNRLDVKLAKGVDNVVALGRIADFYSQQPEHFQGAVDQITVEAGPNPKNDYWAERYSMPGFRSAAVGGGGRITFFNGLDQLKEGPFNHEFGHNVGFAAREAQDRAERKAGTLGQARRRDRQTGDHRSPNIPRGYSEVMRGDGNSISSYGNRSVGEDFAEFYEEFRAAQDRGGQAVEHLRREYPNRFKLFEEQVFVHWFKR